MHAPGWEVIYWNLSNFLLVTYWRNWHALPQQLLTDNSPLKSFFCTCDVEGPNHTRYCIYSQLEGLNEHNDYALSRRKLYSAHLAHLHSFCLLHSFLCLYREVPEVFAKTLYILFMAQHSTIIYFQHFGQLWVSHWPLIEVVSSSSVKAEHTSLQTSTWMSGRPLTKCSSCKDDSSSFPSRDKTSSGTDIIQVTFLPGALRHVGR